jgi:nucleoside-diphosphate-sugar epimerase
MNVLFIGGTGNISTDCATLLHSRGHQIYILSRGKTPVPSAYHSVRADRKDPASMRTALYAAKPDVVLNFIGYEIAEVQSDFDLLQGRIEQYLFISSTTVYSKPPQNLPITEDAPLGNQWWDYAQKKLECERWLWRQFEQVRFPVTIVRPSHTYSKLWIPNQISSASYSFAARLENAKPVFVTDQGETPWTLTASSDFAVGLAGLVGKKEAVGEAFHLTGDEVLTWNQVYAEIASALNVSSPEIIKIPTAFICQHTPQLTGNLKGDKSHPAVFDNSKIKRFVPDFKCVKPFRQGIRESVHWLRDHPDQKTLNPQVDAMIETVIAAWDKQ